MTTEKVQLENPFEALFNKVNKVERLLVDLNQKIDNSKSEHVNPNERITRKQLSKEKNISLGTIHNLMKRGELPYEKIGRKTLFRREDLENCFRNKKGGKI